MLWQNAEFIGFSQPNHKFKSSILEGQINLIRPQIQRIQKTGLDNEPFFCHFSSIMLLRLSFESESRRLVFDFHNLRRIRLNPEVVQLIFHCSSLTLLRDEELFRLHIAPRSKLLRPASKPSNARYPDTNSEFAF